MTPISAIATKKEQGFTLIELVMVIVILGILAAFALPRFADLGSEARASTLNGAAGSVKSAASIAHSACLARAACDDSNGATILLDGVSVNLANAFPEAAVGGIDVAAQIADDFIVGAPTGTEPNRTVLISADNGSGAAQADCDFTYAENTGTVSAVDTSGC